MKPAHGREASVGLLLLAAIASGCQSAPETTIGLDRIDYAPSRAIVDSIPRPRALQLAQDFVAKYVVGQDVRVEDDAFVVDGQRRTFDEVSYRPSLLVIHEVDDPSLWELKRYAVSIDFGVGRSSDSYTGLHFGTIKRIPPPEPDSTLSDLSEPELVELLETFMDALESLGVQRQQRRR